MTEKPRILLVDLSSLFWAAWHVNSENGLQAARSATLAGVKRAMGDGHDTVAICCDGKNNFRKQISADYKAQREKQPEAAYGELAKTKERLAADGYLLWECDGFEADDVIATAAKMANVRGHDVRIVSSDKDLFQLLNVNTDILRSHTWEVWDSRKVTEKLFIDVGQMGDFLALKGDSSDNIPGCPGIGDKRAAELLTRYETLDRIYEALDAGKEVATQSIEKSLRENRAKVELSRKLVALRYDVPIVFDNLFQQRKVMPLTSKADLPTDGDPTDSSPVESALASAESSTDVIQSKANGTSGENVALVPVVEYERQLEPRSLRAAVWLGQHLYDSRLYTRFPTAEAITAIIIRGRELGLGALTALDSFHLIEGRPSPHAYLMIARAKEHPDCEYFQCIETNREGATWETKNRHNPKPTRLTYTLAQAKASGLVQPAQEKTGRDGKKYMSKDNQWVVRPDEMCRKTAGVQLARMEYPAATMGLYAWEELAGDE